MSLFESMSRISEQIQKQRQLMTSEQATILVSVQPFIRALGYDTQNLAEVRPEYTADAKTTGGEKVDYAILREGEPVVFIEAKAASISLNESHWKQLHNYYNARDARCGILTNGLEFRFYTDLKKSNIMDKQPFLTIDMLDLDHRSVAALEYFTKSHFDTKRILAYAQRQEIHKLLRQEMENPSDSLVDHFARSLHHGRMSANDRQRYRGLLREAWRELIDMDIASRLQRHDEVDEVATAPDDAREEPSPPVASGEYIPIYGYYEGHRFEAELRLESVRTGIYIKSKAVRYQGELMPASHATWLAICSVRGEYHSEDWKREKMNSWEFWHVVDPLDGSERILRLVAGWKTNRDDALYQRILSD
ncbi:MAG: type I restriction enzyme HsdR N-terminal domain-containing protein [Chloroflexi bacterium]|nr:type I restriction enzyme HsdR N-terminal domain-containing protein [Chloroflexota bacterium]